MTEPKPTLATLPDDVLILIMGQIDTARGMATLSRTSRRLHHIVRSDGWAIFARGRFPSLAFPPPPSLHQSNGAQPPLGWDKLCDSLTWQSRAWDRRSIVLRALVPQHHQLRRVYASHFHPVIAAHHDLSAGEELVVWGAGQDLVGRWRRRRPRGSDGGKGGHHVDVKWERMTGSSINYGPGKDDITAVALVPAPLGGAKGETMGILAGRENGDLALLSARMACPGGFARPLATFRPEHGVVEPRTTKSVLTSTSRICSIELSRDGKTVAVATQPSLRLYFMPQAYSHPLDEVRPVDVYRLDQGEEEGFEVAKGKGKYGVLHKAKWMPGAGGDVLALSVTDHPDALQYLKITPGGMVATAAAKNRRLGAQDQLSHRICPNSIEPISPSSTVGGNGNLLLSAWRDGTVRLQDIRTPSPLDMVYQDNVDPWSRFESLLRIGTERFVAGGLDGSVVKIFDFRFPRTYHYSSTLPCSANVPMPPPSQPFLSPMSLDNRRATCSYAPPQMGHCTFHGLAPSLFYRPNCSLFFHVTRNQPATAPYPRRGPDAGTNRMLPNDPGVWSLARGADASPHFYIGVAGGIVEASLQGSDEKGDPNVGMTPLTGDDQRAWKHGESDKWHAVGTAPRQRHAATAAAEAQYAEQSMNYSIMETGDGLRYVENERAIRLPPMIKRRDGPLGILERFEGQEGQALRNVWRLDEAFEA